MKKHLYFISILVFMLSVHSSYADHIFGGNMSLTQIDISQSKFKLTLNLFIDLRSVSPSDINIFQNDKHIVKIFSKNGDVKMIDIELPFEKMTDFAYDNEICTKLLGLKTREFTYSKEIILNSSTYSENGGYYIAWARCCRNGGITNIINPFQAGLTLYLEFPALIQNGQKISYNSPIFEVPNGDYICINKPFQIKFAANSVDNDNELKYSIVTPYGSINTLASYSKIVEAGPYPEIKWNYGYSANASIKGNPSLSIDSKTGLLSVTANTLGLFAFSIQCEQLKNGQRVGLVRQDFQLPVVDCSGNTPPISKIIEGGKPVTEIGICEGETITLEVSPAGSNFNFQWQKDGINILGATQTTFQTTSYGSYSVIKSFKSTCANDTISQKVTVKAPTLLKNNATNYSICEGDSIKIEAIPTRNNMSFEWKYNNKVVGSNSYLFADKVGLYYIEGKLIGFNCSSKDSIKVNKKPITTLKIAKRNIALSLGDSRTLQAASDNSQTTFLWTPNQWLDKTSIATPTTTPQDDIEYKVAATTPNMCPVKDSIKVTIIRKIFIPNAFTPNNDSMNDVWEISGIRQYLDNEVYIYNRWGELVYYSKGYQTAFDGKFTNGTDLPVGDYAYMIRVKKSSSNEIIEYKGALVLLR
jgi:gliding motility-associated-like protein